MVGPHYICFSKSHTDDHQIESFFFLSILYIRIERKRKTKKKYTHWMSASPTREHFYTIWNDGFTNRLLLTLNLSSLVGLNRMWVFCYSSTLPSFMLLGRFVFYYDYYCKVGYTTRIQRKVENMNCTSKRLCHIHKWVMRESSRCLVWRAKTVLRYISVRDERPSKPSLYVYCVQLFFYPSLPRFFFLCSCYFAPKKEPLN